MTTKKELQDKIEELESRLTEFKHQLANFKGHPKLSEAKVGDTLEDGCVVIYNSEQVAILMAPKDTECSSHWCVGVTFPIYDALRDRGLYPNQWFLPTVKQLRHAMWCAPGEFSLGERYWSSERCNSENKGVFRTPGEPLAIEFAGKGGHFPITVSEKVGLKVRAFRCVFH